MCGIIAVSSDNAILSKETAETSLKKNTTQRAR